MGKHRNSRWQSYVSGGILKIVQVGTCWVRDTTACMIWCGVTGGDVVIMDMSSTYEQYHICMYLCIDHSSTISSGILAM